jgi:hypothetical protein
MAVEEPGKIDIARVITETVQVIGRNIVTFSVLGLVLSGLPTAIISFVQLNMMRDSFAGMANGTFNFNANYFSGVGVGGLAALITSAILQGTLIYATVQDLSGGKASIGDSLAVGLRNFLPLIGLTILLAFAVVFGFVLLIVPGIMMLCAWCVALPSLVADRSGVFGAFGRSAELTRGNRWRIFALFVLLWVIAVVLGIVFNAISGVSAMGPGGPAAMVARMTSPLFIILLVIRTVITAVISSTLVAVLYVELRKARELGGPQWLAEIFR